VWWSKEEKRRGRMGGESMGESRGRSRKEER
jgi:hypothetical protein